MPVQSDSSESQPIIEYQTPLAGMPLVRGGDILVPAFGITVAAWIAAYLSRMPVVSAPGQVTVSAMLACVLAGGFLTARYSPRGLWAAVMAGAVSGLIDILIVGSMIHDYMTAHDRAMVPSAALWVGGSVLLNAVVAGVGGLFGRIFPSPRRGEIAWTQVFAVVLAAATLPLISAGGLVTAFRAGLAVPDWPQSYGYNMFLFPLSMMQKNEGNFYEHAHRLMGTLVGLTSLALAIYVSLAQKQPRVKIFAWCIFAAVCVQGVLGGTRVTEKSLALAISHGIFAQIVFAGMAALAAATGRKFLLATRKAAAGATTDRFLSAALVACIVIQLVLGAVVRHTGGEFPQASAAIGDQAFLLHLTMATAVLLMVVACALRAWGLHGSQRAMVKTGVWMLSVMGLQLVLGLTALVVRPHRGEPATVIGAIITTAHQANGALLLALAAVMMTWTWRLVVPVEKFTRAFPVITPNDAS